MCRGAVTQQVTGSTAGKERVAKTEMTEDVQCAMKTEQREIISSRKQKKQIEKLKEKKKQQQNGSAKGKGIKSVLLIHFENSEIFL